LEATAELGLERERLPPLIDANCLGPNGKEQFSKKATSFFNYFTHTLILLLEGDSQEIGVKGPMILLVWELLVWERPAKSALSGIVGAMGLCRFLQKGNPNAHFLLLYSRHKNHFSFPLLVKKPQRTQCNTLFTFFYWVSYSNSDN